MTDSGINYESLRAALQCDNPSCLCHKRNGLLHCPAHEDSSPSLNVTLKDGKILVKCHSGCPQDRVISALKGKGLWPSTAGGNGGQAMGAAGSKPRIVATYDYLNAAGNRVFQVCRMEPKSFRQRRPDPANPGKWVWNLQGIERVPYRLPEVLKADTVYLVEGEKDCDNLTALGLCASCNPGGAGKWRQEYNPHFKGKAVVVLPDNDPPGQAHGLDVARQLHPLAASVKVINLPGLPDKGDVSDWLAAGGTKEKLAALVDAAPTFDPATAPAQEPPPDDFDRLLEGVNPDSPTFDKLTALAPLAPILARMTHLEAAAALEGLKTRLDLRAKDLAALESDVKRLRKAREPKGDGPAPEIADLKEVLKLHPAVDFPDGHMALGFRVDIDGGPGLLLVISDGQGVRGEVAPETVKLGERVYQVPQDAAPPFLRDLWGLERLQTFLKNHPRPKNIYADLTAAFRQFLDLPDAAYGLLAAWTVATYQAHQLDAVPFLHFHGPKESGKSKTLEALACLCFNAWKGRDITAAALGDTADGQRGTLLLDQAEKLTNDREMGNLLGLLADSYKRAGGRRRVVECTKAGRHVLEFSTYGPKAFASTKQLDPDLADRVIKIPMTRTRRRLPDLSGSEPLWPALKDKLYRFALTSFQDVRKAYQAIPGDGTRITELWRPLAAVLAALDVGQAEVDAVRGLFMERAEENRHEPTEWEITLLKVLQDRADIEPATFTMTGIELLEAMGIEGDKAPGAAWLGNTIAQYCLAPKAKRRWQDGRYLRVYNFDPARIKKCEIYMGNTPYMAGSTGSLDVSASNNYQSNEPTQKHEPVQAGSKPVQGENSSKNEPTLTGSFKMPGSLDTQEFHIATEGEPTEPAKTGVLDNNFFHFFPEKEVDL